VSDDPNRIDDADLDDTEIDGNTIDPNLIDPNATDADDVDDVDEGDDGDDDGDDENSVPAASAVAVLEYLVQSVVDDPDAVRVVVDENGRRPALNVTVADGDMGRVIGKRGRVAQSIRTVTRAAAARDGAEIDIEFLD
jgi:predicted RNA-binding protein YlqC (UPF0109 family)